MSKSRVTSRTTSAETRRVAPEAGRLEGSHIDTLFDMNQLSVGAMTRLNAQICQSMVRMNTELFNFTSRRLKADCVVAKRLAGAAARPQEAVDAVCDFQKQMVADYAAEAQELASICTSIAIHDDGADETPIEGDDPAEQSDPGADSTYAIESAGEATGTAIAHCAVSHPRAADTDGGTGNGPVITLKASRRKSSTPDVQTAILQVLSDSHEALPLTEIAQQIGALHHAALIRPIQVLCATGRVAKTDNAYRLVS